MTEHNADEVMRESFSELELQEARLTDLAILAGTDRLVLLSKVKDWIETFWVGSVDAALDFLIGLAKNNRPLPWYPSYRDLDAIHHLQALCHVENEGERLVLVIAWYGNLSPEQKTELAATISDIVEAHC